LTTIGQKVNDTLVQFDSLRSRLIIGTTWNLFAAVSNQGSTFAINIIIARILGRQVFGEYSMVLATLLSIVGLVQLSMGYTATKYVAEFRSTDREKTGRILGLCTVVSIAMACIGALILVTIAPWLAAHALKAAHLKTTLTIGTGFLLFSSINSYQMGVLAGLESFRSLARAGVMSGVVAILCISLGAWLLGLNGAVLGLTVTSLLRYIFHKWWLRAELRQQAVKVRYDSLGQERKIIYNFSVPAAISGCYSLPMIWLANSILVRQTGGYGQMALYSAATSIRLLVLFLPHVINNVGLSVLNYVKGRRDQPLYSRVFKSNVLVIFTSTLAMAALVSVFGEFILRAFGKDFSAGHLVLWILLISTAPESISIAIYQYIHSHERLWLSFLGIVIPRETLLVVLAYFLAPGSGAFGLAWAYLIASLVGLFCTSIIAVEARRQNRSRSECIV